MRGDFAAGYATLHTFVCLANHLEALFKRNVDPLTVGGLTSTSGTMLRQRSSGLKKDLVCLWHILDEIVFLLKNMVLLQI